MDLTKALAPKSDQLDFADLDGLPPQVFTITEVSENGTELAEQVVAALADATTEAEVREWGNRAHGRNLLDVQVKGETVRNHVAYRLAELAEPAANPETGEVVEDELPLGGEQ